MMKNFLVGWFSRALGIVASVVLLLVTVTASAQVAQYDFSATTFGGGNWTSAGAYSAPVAGGSVTFTPQSADGNPGDFAHMRIQMPANPGCPTGTWTFLMNSAAIYDPGTSGPIDTIDYRWDSRLSPVERLGGAITLAVQQDGFTWAALNRRLFTESVNTAWRSYELLGLVESDFTYASSWRLTGQPLNPDFSASGSPITFGISNGVSRGFGGVDALCANPPPNGIDTDNWSVTLYTQGPTPGPGELEFVSGTASVAESAGTVDLDVRRVTGSAGAVSVDYATVPVTATADADYTTTAGTLDFADGETSRTLSVPILDDSETEGDESFSVELSNPTGGATLGAPAAATVTIGDDDGAYDLALELAVEPRYYPLGANSTIDVEITITARNLGTGIAVSPFVLLGVIPQSDGDYDYVSDNSGGMFTQNVLAQWTWQTGPLYPGQVRSMTATFNKVDAMTGSLFRLGGELWDAVPQPEPDHDNNRASVDAPVGGVDLGVAITSSTESVTNAGAFYDRAVHDVTISYAAPVGEPARNVAITFTVSGSIEDFDPLPAECGLVSGQGGRVYACAYTELTQDLSFRIRSSESGPATATLLVEVTSDNFERTPDDNSVEGSVFIRDPDIDDPQPFGGSSSFFPCLITTAAYGTAWEPNVVTLRQFRDVWLMTNASGRAFVRFYYKHSPPIAAWLAKREWARTLTRGVLTPLVYSIKYPAIPLVLVFAVLVLSVRRRRLRYAMI